MPNIFLACSENNIGMKQALHFQGMKLLLKKSSIFTYYPATVEKMEFHFAASSFLINMCHGLTPASN